METSKPKVMILTDKDTVGGIRNGYYPEYKDQISVGNLCFVTPEEAKEKKNKGEISDITSPDGEMFVLNPFTQQYVPLTQSNSLETTFVNDEAVAIKRALQMMGAHCVILSEEIEDINKKQIGGNVNVGYNGMGGSIDTKYEKELSIHLKNNIHFLDVRNAPRENSQIYDHLLKTGLLSNSYIKTFYDNLSQDGALHGIEKLNVHFLSELKSSLDIATKINIKMFSLDSNFYKKSEHVHEIGKELKVYFDEVPDEVKALFK